MWRNCTARSSNYGRSYWICGKRKQRTERGHGVEVRVFGWVPGEFGKVRQPSGNKEAGQRRAGIFALKSKASALKLHHPVWIKQTKKPPRDTRGFQCRSVTEPARRIGLGH